MVHDYKKSLTLCVGIFYSCALESKQFCFREDSKRASISPTAERGRFERRVRKRGTLLQEVAARKSETCTEFVEFE